MGLSLSYEFRVSASAQRARELVQQLHDIALTIPFDEVSDITEWPIPAGSDEELSDEDERWLKICGSQYGQKTMPDGEEVWIDIPPVHLIAFGIQPTQGAETAQIGLACHPATLEYQHYGKSELIETDLAGVYSWTQTCKTQYAGLKQYGGYENFERAHLGLIQLLDAASQLGLQVEVKDDSEYFDDRDLPKLRKTLDEWNGLIAAFAGQLKDRLGPQLEHGIQSPIFSAPDFEHLEAKGLDAWTRPESDDGPDNEEDFGDPRRPRH
ncbi:hypothetical protein GC163_18205 [bacterium]|nr:hypothetical protein [bacterium]